MATKQLILTTGKIHECEYITVRREQLKKGQIRLHIEKVALSGNNLSYASSSRAYGDFFPVPTREGKRRCPAWGFGTVIESKRYGISNGQRFYGYLPLGSSELVLEPTSISTLGFADESIHRQGLFGDDTIFYNYYFNCSTDAFMMSPTIDEDFMLVLRVLYETGYLLDVFFEENDFWDAEQVIIASASSKTSLSLAHCLNLRGGFKIVGLTQNTKFCKELGCYDQLLTYNNVDAMIDNNVKTIYVDMAGNPNVMYDVHAHFSKTKKLVYSCPVGRSHVTAVPNKQDVPMAGPAPQFYFVPTHKTKCINDLGLETLQSNMAKNYDSFCAVMKPHMNMVYKKGSNEIISHYSNVAEHGNMDPMSGYILIDVNSGSKM